MKRRLLFFLLLFISPSIFSQDLTGIWRGTFITGAGPFSEQYKYEVQINQLKNYSLEGVTYSYLTTVFYGKATFTGIWFPKAKNALIKELKLIELKTVGNSDACAMTCDLSYSKVDGKEILKGTFTSINSNNKSDCGAGTVTLQRVQESDFHKEDFLKNKPAVAIPSTKNNNPPAGKTDATDAAKSNTKKLQTALGVTPDGSAGPKTIAALKKKLPGFTDKLDVNNTDQINNLINQIKKQNIVTVKKPAAPKSSSKDRIQLFQKKDTMINTVPVAPPVKNEITQVPEKKNIPIPDVIKTRSNPLLKTITTDAPDIKVELYDNGDIDGDTITVYDNNEVIAWKKGLTNKPVTLSIKADANNPVHEFVMVADNLGSIPPNTALMIITTGGKRYQLFVSSDKQKNAKVVVQYQP